MYGIAKMLTAWPLPTIRVTPDMKARVSPPTGRHRFPHNYHWIPHLHAWRCDGCCHLKTKVKHTHDRTACKPLDKNIVSLTHGSHRLWAAHVVGTTSVIYFCHKCGHFTEASLRLLSRQCPGHPHPTFLWRLGRIQKGLHPTHKDVRISAPHKVHTGATCPLPASSSTMASRAEGEGGGFAVDSATTCATLYSPNGDTSCIEEPAHDLAFMAEFFGLDEE